MASTEYLEKERSATTDELDRKSLRRSSKSISMEEPISPSSQGTLAWEGDGTFFSFLFTPQAQAAGPELALVSTGHAYI